MANSADQDQLASSELTWIYTVCKGRVDPGSAGQELKKSINSFFFISLQKLLQHVVLLIRSALGLF